MSKYKYINRERSWLLFNERVLQEAEDPSVPLIERMRFLGIFSNNLDEYFRVRYAAIRRISLVGKGAKKLLGGISAKKLLDEITLKVIEQQKRSQNILKAIKQELKAHNFKMVNETEIDADQLEYLRNYYQEKIAPNLMVYMFGDHEVLSDLQDISLYLMVKMTPKSPESTAATDGADNRIKDRSQMALLEVPPKLDRFVVMPSTGTSTSIILLEDVIRANLDEIFSLFDYEHIEAHAIKISRDAELDIDNDVSKSLIEKVSKSLTKRKRGEPVRLVYDRAIAFDTLQFISEEMGLDQFDSMIPGGRYQNKKDYMDFPDLGRKEWLYERKERLPIKGLSLNGSILEQIGKKDYLLYAPYHKYSYLIKFLREAAIDPYVKSIKITLYRLAKDSQVIASLINAARNGKKVVVQIELRARFDEAANIKWSKRMRQEGIQLIFGVPGLKVHSKICVVEREDIRTFTRYGFISTGNFHESTAKRYTDYTLFTADQGILEDVEKVFEFFEINYRVPRYQHLVVSPHFTRKSFSSLINQEIKNAEAGRVAYIHLRMNSLVDVQLIDKLYTASQAGVKIKLIVRGICSLVPGIQGMSENIEAISIVDKYLEHPRLYIFANGGEEKMYISSADWMVRNLDHRVEVSCPIYDPNIRRELRETFDIAWSDNIKARWHNEEQDNAYRVNDLPAVRAQFDTYTYYDKLLKPESSNMENQM